MIGCLTTTKPPLPTTLNIASSLDVPSELAPFLGVWEGKWNANQDTIVVIEKIDKDKATIILSYGNLVYDVGFRPPNSYRYIEANVLPGPVLEFIDVSEPTPSDVDKYDYVCPCKATFELDNDLNMLIVYWHYLNYDTKFRADLVKKDAEPGKFHDPAEVFKQAIRINPDDADAHYNLARYYGRLEKYQESVDALKQVIRIKPDHAPAHYNLGVSYGRLEKYQESVDAYKQAIRIEPDYIRAHHNLGVSYVILKDKGSALDEYKILKNIDKVKAEILFKGLRVIEWVHLYLLEHTSKDFQTKILLIS